MSIFEPSLRTEEQQIYCETVDRLIQDKSNSLISNRMPEHAVYLIAALIGMANNDVRLYSDRLKHTVSKADRNDGGSKIDLYGHEEVISRVINLLVREGSKISIVVENSIKDVTGHPLVEAVTKCQRDGDIRGSFEIRKISAENLEWLKENKFPQHFIVSDSVAYRLEKDENQDSYSASANFNDTDYAGKLSDLFDAVHWDSAEQLFKTE